MKLDFIWSLCINTIRESFDFNNFVGFFFGWTTWIPQYLCASILYSNIVILSMISRIVAKRGAQERA